MGWAICFAGQEMSKQLTNQDIIDMVSMGISDDVIIAKIRSVNRREGLAFGTGVEGLRAPKAATVPDLPPPEVGVYWKDGATFIPIEGQALSQARWVDARAAC